MSGGSMFVSSLESCLAAIEAHNEIGPNLCRALSMLVSAADAGLLPRLDPDDADQLSRRFVRLLPLFLLGQHKEAAEEIERGVRAAVDIMSVAAGKEPVGRLADYADQAAIVLFRISAAVRQRRLDERCKAAASDGWKLTGASVEQMSAH